MESFLSLSLNIILKLHVLSFWDSNYTYVGLFDIIPQLLDILFYLFYISFSLCILVWMIWSSFLSCVECNDESIKRNIHLWISWNFSPYCFNLILKIFISPPKFLICLCMLFTFFPLVSLKSLSDNYNIWIISNSILLTTLYLSLF